jgi:hypothetical protein
MKAAITLNRTQTTEGGISVRVFAAFLVTVTVCVSEEAV